MSIPFTMSAQDKTAEILSLIKTLHATDERLDELLGGEVDSVMDDAGRSIVLRRAQGHLRLSEQARQSAILESLPANIALLDTRGVIVSVNAAWSQFGSINELKQPGDAVGVNYLELCDQAQGPDSTEAGAAAAGIRSVLRGEISSFSLEYPCHSPGQQRWVFMRVAPLSPGVMSGAVVMHLDVTDRWLAQEAILRINGELEDRVRRRTQQLEAANKELEAFSYSVSHDLRSPLNSINGFSQLLLKSDGNRLSEKGLHYLNRIRAGSTNMGELIDGLLSLAKMSLGTLNRSDINLTAMSSKMVQELRDSEPDRAVDFDIQEELMINGDPAMVAVVMQNLIGNAWKYSGKTHNARVEIGSNTTDDGVTCIFVRDNGAGFDMTYAERLFEIFQRLHSDTEFIGTGIGLANVKRVVVRHGGRVWAQAEPGKGATFRFTLQGAQE